MAVRIELTDVSISPACYHPKQMDSETGSIVEFRGIVRGTEEGQAIRGIEYEAFTEMALHQLKILADSITAKHDIFDLVCVHRVGTVNVGEAAVYVLITSKHRGEGFAAMTEVITRLKEIVPIWKHMIE